MLPTEFQSVASKAQFEFVDNHSPDRLERRARVRRKLGLGDVAIPRYHWQLFSDGFVGTDDIYDHLEWIFNQLCITQPLHAALGEHFQFWFSLFWEGNGTGGGPLITRQTMQLLTLHQAELGIGFYLDRSE